MSTPKEVKGGCLCGSIRYTVTFPDDHDWDDCVGTCQCENCRKVTGSLLFRFHGCLKPSVEFTSNSTLKTFEATPGKQRGFCTNCGSYLYYSGVTSKYMQMAVGCFDNEYLQKYGTALTKAGAHLYCINEIPEVTDHLVVGERFETQPEE